MSGERIRVATLNLHHAAPEGKFIGDPGYVRDACEELDADILALQEVDRRVVRSKWADLARVAANATGMEMRFARTMRFMGGSYGNALLARGDIKDEAILNLDGGKRYKKGLVVGRAVLNFMEPRNALLATVIINGVEYEVAATHLATEPEVNKEQASIAAAELSQRQGMRKILTGDLNQNLVRARTALPGYELADGGPTAPASDPRNQIDHIAVQGDITIVSTQTHRFNGTDHLGLSVELAAVA